MSNWGQTKITKSDPCHKVHVATLLYETKRLTQEIVGGIGETGCMPSYQDFIDSRYGHLVRKYLKAHSPAETRTRIARLIEWLTLGAGVPGCMHGGGSPDWQMPQRGCIIKPRVAAFPLPWVTMNQVINPKGVSSGRRNQKYAIAKKPTFQDE